MRDAHRRAARGEGRWRGSPTFGAGTATSTGPPRGSGLDSSGPWSPKPTRIYANQRVRPRLRAPRKPHGYAVSGASTRPSRLPENRGVPSSILGLAISPFCLLIGGFCACRAAAVRSRWARLSGFGVQFTVQKRPHSWVTGFQPGDKTATLAPVARPAKVRDRQAGPPGVRHQPGVARRSRAARRRSAASLAAYAHGRKTTGRWQSAMSPPRPRSREVFGPDD
jgi:hypothetical protein